MSDKPSGPEWWDAVAAYKATHPEVDWETHIPLRQSNADGSWQVVHRPDPLGLSDARSGPPSNLDQLRSTIDMLQLAYDRAHAELADECGPMIKGYGPVDPMRMRTSDGRYILLDALTVLVQAQTVLAWAEAVQR